MHKLYVKPVQQDTGDLAEGASVSDLIGVRGDDSDLGHGDDGVGGSKGRVGGVLVVREKGHAGELLIEAAAGGGLEGQHAGDDGDVEVGGGGEGGGGRRGKGLHQRAGAVGEGGLGCRAVGGCKAARSLGLGRKRSVAMVLTTRVQKGTLLCSEKRREPFSEGEGGERLGITYIGVFDAPPTEQLRVFRGQGGAMVGNGIGARGDSANWSRCGRDGANNLGGGSCETGHGL